MAKTAFTFETIPDNTAIVTANVGTYGFNLVTLNGGTVTAKSTAALDGSRGMEVTAAAAATTTLRMLAASSGTLMAWSILFRLVSAGTVTTEQTIATLRYASGVTLRLQWHPGTGALSINDASNIKGNLITSGASVGAGGTIYRLEVVLNVGTSTTTGSYTANLYAGTGTTPLASTGSQTGKNLSGPNAVVGTDITTLNGMTVQYDDVQFNDGATTEIGYYKPALATPVPSLGTTTPTTTVGGNDGTQVVTWPAISGATSYEAWIATGSSPAQTDFTLVATGVTSPYTFTGLSAGTYSYGIKAKA